MTTPTLQTPRLVLRPLALEDAAALQPLFNDFEVVQYLNADSVQWPMRPDSCACYYRDRLIPRMKAGDTYAWTIVEKASGKPIGALQISPADKRDSRGFWLGRDYWGQGYISETVMATTDFAFDVLKSGRLWLNNAAPNVASRRMKEKSNARFIGAEPFRDYVGGQFVEEQWELLPNLWRSSPMRQQLVGDSYTLE